MNNPKPPLAGVRVLELCHAIAGPQCCQILADHGADVIKVEPPGGEKGRTALPVVEGESLYFASHNRGKRSISLDLKQPDEMNIFLRMCDQIDIIVTNYSVEVPGKLGWSYDILSSRNPSIIYAHITGFGNNAENRTDKAYDGVIQALSGVPYLTGEAEGPPTLTGTFIADHVTAYQAAMAIMLALIGREQSKQSAYLDISMFDAYFATLAHDVGSVIEGIPRKRRGNCVETAFSDVYKVVDGDVFIAPIGDKAWRQFCICIDHPEWVDNISYEQAVGRQRSYCEKEVSNWMRLHSRQEVIEQLNAAGIPCGSVRSISEAVSSAVLSKRNIVRRVVTPGGKEVSVPGPPISYGLDSADRVSRIPSLGIDRESILADFGIPNKKIIN